MDDGSEYQKKELLPQIANCELLLALAIDETNHHNPANITMAATREGDNFILSGEKKFVVDGHIASKLIVATNLK